jgi:glycosyltransferase involved in cell wall biosynthesis
VIFRHLAINGKFLGARPTGVHLVAEQLIRQLAHRRHDLEELFPKAPTILAPMNVEPQPQISFGLERGGILSGQLWEQLDLPRLAQRALLLNLCNLGPMVSKAAITMIHDAQVFTTPSSYPTAFANWYRAVQPVIGRRHARILTVSEFSARQLVQYGVAPPDRISVIPNGADHILAFQASDEILSRLELYDCRFVVALANLQTHKNIGLLLKAFVDPALASTKLVLVGSADRKQFETCGHIVPQNVVFAGRVDDGEMRSLLGAAACLAFPSTTEGFGLPPLEAMTLGCPVVLAPCGALPEIAGEAALYAPADDPRSWVEAIGGLLKNSAIWEKYSRAGRERAKLFSWARAGEKLVAAIRGVVIDRRRRLKGELQS